MTGDRCPEEEGIKTPSFRLIPFSLSGDRCPEEEGIKTRGYGLMYFCLKLVTDALKKKGLRRARRAACRCLPAGDRCPEEEGIKTVLSPMFGRVVAGDRCPEEEGIKTACCVAIAANCSAGDRCPEEEGIKTLG